MIAVWFLTSAMGRLVQARLEQASIACTSYDGIRDPSVHELMLRARPRIVIACQAQSEGKHIRALIKRIRLEFGTKNYWICVLGPASAGDERRHALNSGADEWFPCSEATLADLPLICARRLEHLPPSDPGVELAPPLVLFLKSRLVRGPSREKTLCLGEFCTLHVLVQRAPQVVERDELRRTVGARLGRDVPLNTLHKYVGRIRSAIVPDEVPIQTVRGVGYRYVGLGQRAWTRAARGAFVRRRSGPVNDEGLGTAKTHRPR